MKIKKDIWFWAGVAGGFFGAFPLVLIWAILNEGFGIELHTIINELVLGLLFGGWGGAYVYHRMTFGGNKW